MRGFLIPPQILENAKAVIFVRKTNQGTKKTKKPAKGLLFLKEKNDDHEKGYSWSLPIALSMVGNIEVESKAQRCDLLCFINNERIAAQLAQQAQADFREDMTMGKGIVVEDLEDLDKLVATLADRPDIDMSSGCYSYGMKKGSIFQAHLDEVRFYFRQSSNDKFYKFKGTSPEYILSKIDQSMKWQNSPISSAHLALNFLIEEANLSRGRPSSYSELIACGEKSQINRKETCEYYSSGDDDNDDAEEEKHQDFDAHVPLSTEGTFNKENAVYFNKSNTTCNDRDRASSFDFSLALN